jgi:alkane 1-monooxygenase
MPVISAFGSILFLGAFALLPLHWVSIGAPWVPLLVTFIAIPLIDRWVGPPRGHSDGASVAFVRYIPRMQLIVQSILLVQVVRIASNLEWGELVVFGLAVGTVTGGIGITVAHELAHRAERIDRFIAKALLVSVGYGHFVVEHVRGHHVRVGTPDDPATAPRGMSVYRFIARSVAGSFKHAWRLEKIRLQHERRPPWSLRNWVLSGSLLSLLMLAVAATFGGAKAALVLSLQAAWAIVLLEVINYIEHYGLQRRRINDRYEPVREEHSWNANYTVSNWLLFNLQLHPDHHTHVQRPFDQLRSVASAPQLPAGYPAMVLLALVPPAWYAVMNPRLPVAA